MNEAIVSFVGNIGGEPVLRFTDSGKAVLNFRVCVNQTKKINDEWKDTNATWYECTLWESKAEAAVEILKSGARVFVTGKLTAEEYTNKENKVGMALKVEPTSLGLDLLAPQKKNRTSTPVTDDPWASSSGGDAPF